MPPVVGMDIDRGADSISSFGLAGADLVVEALERPEEEKEVFAAGKGGKSGVTIPIILG